MAVLGPASWLSFCCFPSSSCGCLRTNLWLPNLPTSRRIYSSSLQTTQLPNENRVLHAADADAILAKLKVLGIEERAFDPFIQPGTCSLDALWRKVDLLLAEGVSADQVKTMLKDTSAKEFVRISDDKLVRSLSFLKTLGVTGHSLGKVLIREPLIVNYTAGNLESKINYFGNLGLEWERLKRAFEIFPSLLFYNIETVDMRLQHLRGMGMNDEAICEFICKFPRVVSLRVDENVKHTLEHFQERGMNHELLCKYVMRCPRVLSYSKQSFTKKMEFLEELGFDKNSVNIVKAYFCVCSLSYERLQEKINWLMSLGLSHSEACQMLRKMPTIFKKRNESLMKSIDYFLHVLNRDLKELVTYPNCLCYSLEKRVIPRFNLLIERKQKGMLERDYSLGTVLTCSNTVFQERFGYRAPKGSRRNPKR